MCSPVKPTAYQGNGRALDDGRYLREFSKRGTEDVIGRSLRSPETLVTVRHDADRQAIYVFSDKRARIVIEWRTGK
jgi:hypothetical protein